MSFIYTPVARNIQNDEAAPLKTDKPFSEMDNITLGLQDNRMRSSSPQGYGNRLTQINTNYPIFAYMFNKSKSQEHIKESEIIYFDRVVEMMKKACEPLIFEFVEESENRPFLEVKAKFFEFLFFRNVIWVWYDTEEEKFYLLDKKEPDNDKSKEYYDVLNNKDLILPAEEPIKCMWDGRDNSHFDMWFRVCYRALSREQVLEKMFFLNGKRVKFTTETDGQSRSLQEELFTTDPFINASINSGLVEPFVAIEPETLNMTAAVHYMMWDRDMAELGRVANINEKEERKTTGENYKDIHAVVCRQQGVLDQLKLFAKKLEEIKGVSLVFKVLGVIDKTKDPMEDQQHMEDGGGQEDTAEL